MASSAKKKVVLFGGSFNPPHRGHAAFARAAATCGDELWVLPSGDRTDKAPGRAEARRALAEAFAEDLAETVDVPVRVETIELELAPPTWTYRTLRTLAERHPDLSFAVAATSEILPDVRGKWEDGPALWREASFVLAARPGHAVPDDAPPSCSWIEIDAPVTLSSTEIRDAIAAGRDVGEFLTPNVCRLISEEGHYRADTR